MNIPAQIIERSKVQHLIAESRGLDKERLAVQITTPLGSTVFIHFYDPKVLVVEVAPPTKSAQALFRAGLLERLNSENETGTFFSVNGSVYFAGEVHIAGLSELNAVFVGAKLFVEAVEVVENFALDMLGLYQNQTLNFA